MALAKVEEGASLGLKSEEVHATCGSLEVKRRQVYGALTENGTWRGQGVGLPTETLPCPEIPASSSSRQNGMA